MSRGKKGRTHIEICIFVGFFLFIFVSLAQILVMSHRSRGGGVGAKQASVVSRETALEKRSIGVRSDTPRRTAVKSAVLQSRIRSRTRAQQEVRELERSLAKLMRENTVTPEEANSQFANQLYARRVGSIIQKVQEDGERLYADAERVNGSAESRAVSNNHSPAKDIAASSSSKGYGVPLSFRSHTGRDIITKGKSKMQYDRFRELDSSEEYELKATLTNDPGVEEAIAEKDRLRKEAKRAQEDGAELFVDEEALKAESGSGLDVCPKVPDSLVGKISSMNLSLEVDISEVLKNNSDIREGGEWQPSTCISRHRVAIIVPYRDRWSHLKTLLYYLLPILKRQQIHFRIFVVEQYGNDTFNKGRIMNAAFREAVKLFDFQCVTFHDVDLVPEDDRNMYSCTQQPKHMSIAIDKFLYVLPYQGLVGGVLSFHSSHFQQVNGYSNMYWGWGAEDDDMTTRILHRGLRIYRPPSNIGRYKMVKHDGRKHSEMTVRMKLLRSAARRSKLEGLNNVQYKLVYAHNEKLFTHFMVDIGHP